MLSIMRTIGLGKRQVSFENYGYGVMWASTKNFGDDIQTLSAINLLKQNGIEDFVFVDRENMHAYRGKPIKLIANGWFMHKTKHFPPSKYIKPIFIGVHMDKFCEENVIKKHANYFKKYMPIGCRDLATMQAFHRHGIDAYFSGCLTLTFDKAQTTTKNIFLVDIDGSIPYIPYVNVDLGRFANEQHLTHEIYDKSIQYTPENRLRCANVLLDQYRAARLIITSRLHCALPCRAFNTDVVFYHKNYHSDIRFTGLNNYLNGYDGGENSSPIDLSKKSVEYSIIDNLRNVLRNQVSNLL